MHPARPLIRFPLLLLYAASGALALVYEIAWARRLALVFGSTHLAAATGLVAFIGGLALGARWCAARAATTRNPLRLYAWLEILVGAFGLASPWILDAVQGLYLATWPGEGGGALFVGYRFALVAATLVVPTALMGATVPAMTRVFGALGYPSSSAFGLPLGVNTAGALGGVMLSGFVLLPKIGLHATLLAAGAANVLLGIAAWGLASRARDLHAGGETPPEDAAPTGAAAPRPRLLMLAAALTGACGLGLEIAWTRLLALVLGSTAYAFTLMLASYLLGLALGTLAGSRLAPRVRSPERALAWVFVLFAASAWAGVAFANELPFWFLGLYRALGGEPSRVMAAQSAIALAMMLVPAAASGMVLPLVVRGLRGSGPPATVGGRVYAVNTAAGIGGVALFTFVLIPSVSLRIAIMTAAGALAAFAMLLALAGRAPVARGLPVAALAALTLGAIGFLVPAFRPALFATAVYRYADKYRNLSRAEFETVRNPATSPVLFDEDGFVARVTVVGPADDPSLLLDGKGASAGGDVPTEILLAKLPLLFAKAPRTALVIGHGAGVTTRAALGDPRLDRVDSVEIEAKVLACSRFFRPAGEPDAPDTRLRLIVNDGRNHLLATRSTYDVICSQPSNPWVSGAAPLFTAEAYRAGARRLAPGGIFCQWLQTYEMSEKNLRVLVRTFGRVFPHVAMFLSTVPGNVYLLGSSDEIRLDRPALEDSARGELGVQMRRAGIEAPAALLALFCFRDEDLLAWAGDGALNSDDDAYIEFALPFDLFTNRASELHTMLRVASRGLPALVGFPEGTPAAERAQVWHNWGVSLKTAGRVNLSREAMAEADRFR